MTVGKRTIATKPGEPTKHVDLTPAQKGALTREWNANAARKAKEERLNGYKIARAAEYPKIGDQLDAILKHLNYMQMNGETNLVSELDGVVGQWLAVKAKYPKPEDTE